MNDSNKAKERFPNREWAIGRVVSLNYGERKSGSPDRWCVDSDAEGWFVRLQSKEESSNMSESSANRKCAP